MGNCQVENNKEVQKEWKGIVLSRCSWDESSVVVAVSFHCGIIREMAGRLITGSTFQEILSKREEDASREESQ